MVKVLSAKSNFTALMSHVPEALFSSDTKKEALSGDFSWADAIVIGPGIGTGKKAAAVLADVLSTRGIPAVIDADGINLISEDEGLRDALREKAEEDTVILTPHLMEMSRFTGIPPALIKNDIANTALSYARSYNTVIALKDARTVTASPEGDLIKNTTGNNGMSTAGSGDVLAGLAGSLLAQGLNGFRAASIAVFLHGLAGDIAADRYGVRGMKAMDIAESLPEAFLKVEEDNGFLQDMR